MMTGLATLDLAAVSREMERAGVVTGTLSASLIAGGRSNLTYRIADGDGQWVLRMPPRSGRTPSAHDVAREYRVTSALAAGSDIPVARPVLLCEDESVLGGPFTVVEHVEGAAIRTREQVDEMDARTLARVVDDLLTVLARLHRTDIEKVGLQGWARAEGYAERQLRRWSGQWELVGASPDRPAAAELIRRLEGNLPHQHARAVVHGDYRIDNTLLCVDSDRPVRAVVDWELSTLGDPVADVALMCAYRDSAFDLITGGPSAWASPNLPDTEGVASRYEAAGGVPLVDFGAHLALANFKIAVIAAGIDHRHRAGAMLGPGYGQIGQAAAQFLENGLSCTRSGS
jgi:aminoglycoside phosphotransferase (APT) family kinase protein